MYAYYTLFFAPLQKTLYPPILTRFTRDKPSSTLINSYFQLSAAAAFGQFRKYLPIKLIFENTPLFFALLFEGGAVVYFTSEIKYFQIQLIDNFVTKFSVNSSLAPLAFVQILILAGQPNLHYSSLRLVNPAQRQLVQLLGMIFLWKIVYNNEFACSISF